ncbi:MAG: hypothetical protein R3A10_12730 [Caldilineaceae bacterium]
MRARTQWANIVSGVFVALIVLLLAPVVGPSSHAAMAGLLIVVGIQSIKVDAIVTVYQTSKVAATVMFMTALTALIIPLQFAVFVGVAFSILLHSSAVSTGCGSCSSCRWKAVSRRKRAAPTGWKATPSPYSTSTAASFLPARRRWEKLLPSPVPARSGRWSSCSCPGFSWIGGTFLGVLRRYADNVKAAGGKVILTGVDDQVRHQRAHGHAGLLGRTMC